MTTDRPQHPFTVTSRDVWAIALPACLAFITEPMVGFVDITIIGRLGDAALLGGLVLLFGSSPDRPASSQVETQGGTL